MGQNSGNEVDPEKSVNTNGMKTPEQPPAQESEKKAEPQKENPAFSEVAASSVAERQRDSRTQVRPVKLQNFDSAAIAEDSDKSNFELIQNVPLEISVEVGRAKKSVRDVLEICEGSIIELNKQAGDPVDVIVNGRLLAHGEVVVIDENFGVRITEIVNDTSRGE